MNLKEHIYNIIMYITNIQFKDRVWDRVANL